MNHIRIAARQKAKLKHQMKTNVIGEKLLWFKEHLNSGVEEYTPELLLQLIEKYLSRFDEELEQIKLKHSVGKRKGRQHASREDTIKLTISQERNEFNTCGIELPEFLNVKQFNNLKNWSGELRFLQNFKLVRYSKPNLQKMIKSEVEDKQGGKKNKNVKEKEEKSDGQSKDEVEEGEKNEDDGSKIGEPREVEMEME